MKNPYAMAVPANGHGPISVTRRALEPIIAEHMEGFGAALEGRVPKNPADRVRAHMLLRVGAAALNQSRHVAMELISRSNPLAASSLAGGLSMEAALGSSTLLASVTDFITQMIHTSLDVYPRLIAPRLVSMQPFTQPSGYIFYLRRVAKDNGSGGSGDGRNLAELDTFDKTYSLRAAEGDQVKAVGIELEKVLVEVNYHALMGQWSHEVDVALRSQYGYNIEALTDIGTADELAWEVDRTVVDALVAFAETNPAGIVYFDDTKGGTYDTLSPSEQQAYDKQFMSRTITGVSIDMAGKIFRTPNWYVCGLNIAKLLARTPEHVAMKSGDPNYYDQMAQQGTIISSGKMADGAQIWMDPQMDADTMVAGYTDNMNPFYAGYCMCPFGLASLLTQAFLDPDVLLTKKSRALAFAHKGIKPEQYRVIKLGTGS